MLCFALNTVTLTSCHGCPVHWSQGETVVCKSALCLYSHLSTQLQCMVTAQTYLMTAQIHHWNALRSHFASFRPSVTVQSQLRLSEGESSDQRLSAVQSYSDLFTLHWWLSAVSLSQLRLPTEFLHRSPFLTALKYLLFSFIFTVTMFCIE